MISTALTPTAATAVAALAMAACECRSTWCQAGAPGGLTGVGKPEGRNEPARATTLAWWARPADVRSAQIRSTCSRKPGDMATIGAAPASSAGLSSRRLRSPQTSHCSMCLLTRLRIRTVSWPSQPASMASRSGQACRPVRATISAPSERSSWLRARDSKAWAWLRDTPRAAARSSPASSCRRLSSMTSRSAGFSPPSASRTRSRSSACSATMLTSGDSAGMSTASSSADVAWPERSWRKHSFLATAYSQGRSLLGSLSPPSLAVAIRNVSCTASAASAGSGSMDRQ